MEKERHIHYIDSFKFSFVMPVYPQFRYDIKVKTAGLNKFMAGLEYRRHEWFCNNCEVNNNEITVFVRNHNLAPGKVFCEVRMLDKEGREVETVGIDPHITLTYDHIHQEKGPNDMDIQQSIDIVKLYDNFYQLRDRVTNVEEEVDHKTGIKDRNEEVIKKMWITYDDEEFPPVYTKPQVHERFVEKSEMKKYVKEKNLNEYLHDVVKKKDLKRDYFDKHEACNLFLKDGDVYSKKDIDKLLYALRKEIEEIRNSIA